MDISKQFSLEGKVALVTGAAYGIGFAIAEGLAAAGAKIAFNCRGEKHMQEALENYKAKGIEAHGYFADVTKEEDIKELVAAIERDLGGIDILVNNAGIIKRIPMIEMETADFRQVVDIDAEGFVFVEGMGKCHLLPSAVVERGPGGSRVVSHLHQPAGVEIVLLARRESQAGENGHNDCCKGIFHRSKYRKIYYLCRLKNTCIIC